MQFQWDQKKGVMSIRKDNWVITPIDNQLYFFWNDSITLSLISPFVGRRFQELENCNSAVREIVLAAPHTTQQGTAPHTMQHASMPFTCFPVVPAKCLASQLAMQNQPRFIICGILF